MKQKVLSFLLLQDRQKSPMDGFDSGRDKPRKAKEQEKEGERERRKERGKEKREYCDGEAYLVCFQTLIGVMEFKMDRLLGPLFSPAPHE